MSALVIVGIVFGALALASSWYPPVGIFLGIVGLVCSYLGMKSGNAKGAKAGLGLSIAALVISILLALFFVAVIGSLSFWASD
jgi:hypothetical protein